MAITSEQQSDILKLVAGLFNATPGGRNLTDLANAVESGMTMPQLADYLAGHPLFTHDIMAGKVTTAAQVGVLMNHFGLTADPADETAPGSQAEFFFTARINEGVGFGAIVLEAVNFLSQENLPEEFAPTAALLNNKVLVSELYSQATPDSSADLPTLQSILVGVTAEGPSTEAEALTFLADKGIGEGTGETFVLTANQDILTGTTGNDTFIAGSAQDGAGNLIQTLQDVDSVNGGEGTDSINVTLLGTGAVSPTLTSVENVNVRFTTAGAGDLDLSSSSGVNTVTVANSTQVGAVSGLGDAATIAVANQSQNVTFSGSTAADLTVSLNNVGAAAATTVDLGDAAATSLTLNLTGLDDSTVALAQAAATATSITVNLAGDSTVDMSAVDGAATSLSVSGAGSLTPTAGLAALTELNVSGDASVDLSANPSTTIETVAASGTTGDVTVVVDGSATAIATGSGNDSVTLTDALAADATVDLGDGDDTYVIGAATDDATATVEGGVGEDTLSTTTAILATPITNPEIYTGFEVLAMTDVLADATSIDVSGFTGVDSFKASAGVAALGTATVTGVGSDATVTLAGDLATNNGALNVTLADASGSADSVTLMVDTLIAQNNDATVDTTSATVTTSIAGVETLNVGSTGTLSTEVTTGNETDVAHNTLALTDDALVTLNIGGDQMLTFASAASMEDLATIDASTNTAGVNIDVSLAAATAAAMTITGSAADDTITGSANADTISGGEGNDTITGGAGADALSGGAGNDIFAMLAAANSSLVNLDVISDFAANTVGQGADGAVNEAGAAASSDDWTGDVIDLSAIAGALTKIDVSVQANSSDAQTFLQNLGDATADTIGVALDSSTGRLFIDVTSDGTVDSVIELTGVSTIDEAAFVIA